MRISRGTVRLLSAATVFLLLGLPANEPAKSAAWTMKKGEGRVIATALYSHAANRYDDNGDVFDAPGYAQQGLYLLGEYGLNDHVTLIVSPSIRRVAIEGREDGLGLGYTELGARNRIVSGKRSVLSLQATARMPGNELRDEIAQIGSSDPEYDFRVQGGHSFGQNGTAGFAIAEAGYRIRAGDPPNEFRGVLTVGVRPAKGLMVIGTSDHVKSDGAGTDSFPAYNYHNLRLTAVYDITPNLALQFGGLATMSGRNALRERGFSTGFWFTF